MSVSRLRFALALSALTAVAACNCEVQLIPVSKTTLTIISPQNNASYGGDQSFTFEATASNALGISSLALYGGATSGTNCAKATDCGPTEVCDIAQQCIGAALNTCTGTKGEPSLSCSVTFPIETYHSLIVQGQITLTAIALDEKQAPRGFASVSGNGVPWMTVVVMSVALLVGVLLNYLIPENVFLLIASIATFATVWVWLMILLSQVAMRRKMHAEDVAALKFPVPFWPLGPLLAIAFMVFVIAVLGYFPGTQTALGVGAISGGGWCTFADPERFYSHRRDAQARGSSGRLAALV